MVSRMLKDLTILAPRVRISKTQRCAQAVRQLFPIAGPFVRYLCCGFSTRHRLVVFRTAADAQAAINTLQDFNLMGRPIFLREYFDEPQSLSAPGGHSMAMGRPAMGMMGRPGGGGFGGGGFGGGGAGTCKVRQLFVTEL